ncbi:MAG: lipid A export permease/ATP-binding protein MsbA [Oceanococcaceae bacterium]
MKAHLPDPPRTSREIYLRLLQYARPHGGYFVIAVLGMAGYALADVSFIALMKPLLDESFVAQDEAAIAGMPWIILLLFLFRGVAAYASAYGMAAVGRAVIKSVREDVFEHFLQLPVSYYDRSSSGNMLARLTYHSEQVAESTSNVITAMVKDGLTVVGLVGVMFWMEWRLALFVLVVGPIIAVLVGAVSKQFRVISRRIQDSMGGVSHVAEEIIQAQRVVKLFGGQAYERAQFLTANEANRRMNVRLVATRAGSTASVQFIAAWAVAAIIYIATSPTVLDSMTPGTFVAFMGAMLALMGPLKHLTNLNEKLQKGIAAATDIFALLYEPVEADDGEELRLPVRGAVRFERVGFAYPGSERPVLDNITLDIAPGETVAFVGRSGSGKSTLLSLLPRFYEPRSGVIYLDEQPIQTLNPQALRRQIALVDQNVTLFNDTIARNIAYGELADASRADIQAAAERAHAWEFIRALPQGLDTPVGPNGVMLSGGQRQRLAIARALLKPAPLLILDEATSALDTESERVVQDALMALMEGRTTLVIAHRLSTVLHADRIVVIDQGRIVETGTHTDLLARDGEYAALYRLQFAGSDGAAEISGVA